MKLTDQVWSNHKGESWRVVVVLDAEKLAKSKTLNMIVDRATKHPKGKATGFYGAITVTATKQ